MARPGMTRWRTRDSPAEGSDEVQRSLELLDQVLSEFDDLENGNVAAREVRAQLSEDDGYMSMNGRRAKFVLNFRPPPPDGEELPPTPEPCGPPPPELADFPPPPEEAERIISTLLPKVSPGNSTKRAPGTGVRHGHGKVSSFTLGPHFGSHDSRVTTATQTTLPKTRHQRPFGWENSPSTHPHHHPSNKFGSLPYDSSHQWLAYGPAALPPRTCPTAVDRHREVRRRTPEEENGEVPLKTLSETTDDDHANFSDDSLEELLPPPPPTSKRSSIAWEVPLDLDEEAMMTPGSTKVVGRRRRKSTDRSSTGSNSRLKDQDDWPDPPTGTEDGSISPFSDWDSSAGKLDDGSFLPPELSASDLSASGTYVIRKGRRKERTPVPLASSKTEKLQQSPSHNSNSKLNELKRCSSTFDNIKSLLKEGLIEGLDETPPDFQPPTPPALVRVVSLPTLTIEEACRTEPLQIVEEVRIPEIPKVEEVRIPEVPKVEDVRIPEVLKVEEVRIPEVLKVEEVKKESKSVEVEVKSCDVGVQVMDDLPVLSLSEKPKESVEESTQVSLEYRDVNDKSTELSKSCDSVVDSITSKTEEALILKLQQDQTDDYSSSEDILSPSFTSVTRPVNSFEIAKEEVITDPWLTASEISEVQVVPVVEEESEIKEEVVDKPPGDFNVMVEVLQHEFGPLPPSPVEEDEDEYNDVLRNSPVRTSRGKADSVPEPFYRCLEPPGSDPIGAKFLNRPCPDPPPHKEPTSSLKTRSMDAGFSRNHKNQHSNSRSRDIPSERRTLPSELPGPSRRRTFQKRGSSQSPREEGHMQVSCSLPETPIFARGCDIPRTPHRRAPEVPPTGTRTTPRPPGIQTSSYRRTPTTVGHGTTGSTTTLGQAMVGAELLRLTGGPGRGWYPRHRNPRPASVEHLDHLAHPAGANTGTGTHGWDSSHPRKPLTLPPNLTPKFFHRSPREALRRVTSLLIRKDDSSPAPPVPPHNTSLQRKQGNSKDSKKDQLSPTQAFGPNGEEGTKQKRGFFKSFWKRSRHYSLEQQ
ncbi:uncharacterized protein LOC128999445 isoform X1 [Macrosteles quadrilineatus]|uniref:uncharacterized protein LOC128999445 isoform X1 n=1 Tax=Macrosteles quadrilineatus TaxID=74068 RepID=UPI0023E2B8AA|nr:uncharacterized protein LOC128999445 isoform X1 [Macrosteles quadrilineatus]